MAWPKIESFRSAQSFYFTAPSPSLSDAFRFLKPFWLSLAWCFRRAFWCPNWASLSRTRTRTDPASNSNWSCSLLSDQFCNSLPAFVFLTQDYWGDLYWSRCRGQLRIKISTGGGRQRPVSPFPWLLICLVLLNAAHLHGITVTSFSLAIHLDQSQGHCFLLSTLHIWSSWPPW